MSVNPVMKKVILASSITMALAVPGAHAALVTNVLGANTWYTDSANFTMLNAITGTTGTAIGGLVVGGTNDVLMTWDGDAFNASSDYTGPGSYANVTASSTAPFFGKTWTAHDIQVFVPGNYSFDVGDNTPGAGTGGPAGANGEVAGDMLNVTVPVGYLGMHMLFDWNSLNIDMFIVFDQNNIFGSGFLSSTYKTGSGIPMCTWNSTAPSLQQNCLYSGGFYGSAGVPTQNQVWMLASVDGNGDGIMGIPMAAGGPFQGLSANFNANLTATPKPSAVPIPAAAWLFGSGLMGLFAAARRRKGS